MKIGGIVVYDGRLDIFHVEVEEFGDCIAGSGGQDGHQLFERLKREGRFEWR